jgi:hypothetical protein
MARAGEMSDGLRRIGRAGPNAAETELLRAATLDVEPATAAWRRWISTHTVDEASPRAVDLLPAVSANLPAEVFGVDADRLRGLRRRAWADAQFRLAVIAGAAEVLGPLGITPLVTKGAALSSTVYAEPGIRPMSDVDVVVGADRFAEVMGAFATAGWHRPSVVDSPFDHAVELYDPQHRAIDVHRWVLFPRFAAVPEVAWIERAVPHVVRDCEVVRFRCADEMVLAILHGLLVSGSSSVRWPLDVVQAARRGHAVDGVAPEDFWDEVIASASSIGAGPIVADALEMCRVEFDASVPAGVVAQLSAARVDRQLAQHWALCRRGVTIEWRIRRYRKLCHIDGRRATVGGYVGPRFEAMRTKGFGDAVSARIARVKQIVNDKLRD